MFLREIFGRADIPEPDRLDTLTREAHFQAQPMQLYLTENFHEPALAFKEKRQPRPFKGR